MTSYKKILLHSIRNNYIDSSGIGIAAIQLGMPKVLREIRRIKPFIYKEMLYRSLKWEDYSLYNKIKAEMEENSL
jgi:hypothetical protein